MSGTIKTENLDYSGNSRWSATCQNYEHTKVDKKDRGSSEKGHTVETAYKVTSYKVKSVIK